MHMIFYIAAGILLARFLAPLLREVFATAMNTACARRAPPLHPIVPSTVDITPTPHPGGFVPHSNERGSWS
jgi:hypothetical protein